jgi:hypothetical protein
MKIISVMKISMAMARNGTISIISNEMKYVMASMK